MTWQLHIHRRFLWSKHEVNLTYKVNDMPTLCLSKQITEMPSMQSLHKSFIDNVHQLFIVTGTVLTLLPGAVHHRMLLLSEFGCVLGFGWHLYDVTLLWVVIYPTWYSYTLLSELLSVHFIVPFTSPVSEVLSCFIGQQSAEMYLWIFLLITYGPVLILRTFPKTTFQNK